MTSLRLPICIVNPIRVLLLLGLVLLGAVHAQVNLTVNANLPVRTVDERVFGVNSVIWDQEASTTQTIGLVQAAGIRSIRVPGGSLSDEYHWRVNKSLANAWTWLSHFGKFAQLISSANAQAMVTVNYGSGTPQEAAALVAYLNSPVGGNVAIGTDGNYDWGTSGTWAAVRASANPADEMSHLRIGRSTPLGAKYFEIGNECYGTWEHDDQVGNAKNDPTTYANRAQLYMQAMKAVDPTIKIGVVVVTSSENNSYKNWTPVMLARLKVLNAIPDFIIYHKYPQAPGQESDATLLQVGPAWTANAADLRQQLTTNLGANGAGVEIVVTENNSVYSSPGKQSTSLVNGLYLADSIASVMKTEINAFMWWGLRNGPPTINNGATLDGNMSASLYGWRLFGDYGMISMPSTLTGETTYYNPYPTYYMMKLLQYFARGGDTVVTATTNNNLLAVYAAKRADGTLSLLVLNKDPTNTLGATFALTGFNPAATATTYTYGKTQDSGLADILQGTASVSGTTFAASFGSYSATVLSLTAVVAPSITLQPISQTVTLGGSVTFTAAASGDPTPTFQWQKNGSPIGGATGSSYTIAIVVPGDAGIYTVVATNSVTSVTSNPATLAVNVPPVIAVQPHSQTAAAGSPVTFDALATGTPPPTYQWKKNNVNIQGATSNSYTIASTVVGDAGNYTVVATNVTGSATSLIVTLTINTLPVFTLQPQSQSVNAGAPVTFTTAASGTPVPTYQWQKNGSPIGGATGSSFTIASVGPGDLGTYTVVATNSVGPVISNPATLIFNVAPAITTQPVSQAVMANNPVTFTVVATGIPASSYQWRKNGVNLVGATGSSLVIGAASEADIGTYSIVVTNAAGTATSSGATLAVQASSFNLASSLWLNPSAGLCNLWLMNGTAFGSGASLGPIPTAWRVVAATDFNGDGQGDIVWQNTTTGQRRIWLMNGANFGSEVDLGTYDPVWQMVTAVDFNSDGQPDILWQNTATGQRTIWLMNGTAYNSAVDFGIYDVSWQMVTAVDFNGDGSPDILWQNTATGQRTIWLMSGTNYSSAVDFGIYDIRWQMMTAADFNGDGHPDILWQNTATGQRTIWLLNGTTYDSAVNLGTQNPRWRAAAVGDFNGDGQVDILWQASPAAGDFNGDGYHDILWQNTVTGQRTIWLMNGTTYSGAVDLGTIDANWQIVTAVDFNGDGQSDILWQNTSTGQRRIWLLNGTTFNAEVNFGTYDISWQMVAAADFNGDGHPDILWQNTTTGQRLIWLMNGTTYMAAIDFGIYDVSWQMVTAADFDGDGHPDILWQNTATGRRTIWLMDGTTYNAGIDFGTYDVNWQMVAAADFNDDSQTDILWQNTATGQRTIWLMNGTAFGSGVDLGTYDLDWQIRN